MRNSRIDMKKVRSSAAGKKFRAAVKEFAESPAFLEAVDVDDLALCLDREGYSAKDEKALARRFREYEWTSLVREMFSLFNPMRNVLFDAALERSAELRAEQTEQMQGLIDQLLSETLTGHADEIEQWRTEAYADLCDSEADILETTWMHDNRVKRFAWDFAHEAIRNLPDEETPAWRNQLYSALKEAIEDKLGGELRDMLQPAPA